MESKKIISMDGCVRPSVRPSLLKTLERVKTQIEYDSFTVIRTSRTGREWAQENGLVSEMCMIIAETLLINPDKEITINGEKIPAFIVQEIFSLLTRDHIELVLDKISKIADLIQKKSPYMRTALYNSVREIHTHYANLVRHDMGY